MALLAAVCSASDGADVSTGRQVSPITKAQEVLDLGLERSRVGGIPVRLRGVMTYQTINRPAWFFVQDDTAAVLVIASNQLVPMVSGQLVEVEGMAAAGIWVPYVQGLSLRVLGTAPMPVPKSESPAQLAAGANFGHWVEVQGTVRDVAFSKNRILFLCVENGQLFQVWSAHPEPLQLPLHFLDARVRLRGVPWMDVGYERRPFGFKLHQPGTNCIQVLSPGSADIFQGTLRSVQSLRHFVGDRNIRVKVKGVVTAHSPAGWLCLQDDTGSLLAWQLSALPRDDDPRGQFRKRDQPALHPGDQVELVGAPLTDRPFAPVLEDAEYKVTGKGLPPPARLCSIAEVMSGQHDAELVRLKARVADAEWHRVGELFEQRIWLQAGESTFDVSIETREDNPSVVRKDDFVVVTGICRVQPGQFRQIRSFSLHLRGPEDLTITRPPRWWTLRWAAWLVVGGSVILVVSVVWISLLRRQVARRTTELSDANARLMEEIQERRRFVSVIEATSDLVGMASLEGQPLYLNRAGRRMMDLPEDFDITGLQMWEFYPEDVNRMFREVALPISMREGLWAGEIRLLTASKREIPVSFVGLVIKKPDGTPVHLACVARDISERRRIEEDLRAALAAERELNQLKSNFVSMVSHEFRTPLGAIQSSAELLHNYFDRLPPERRERLVNVIVSSTAEMARMMEDVLLLSRVESARYAFQPRETSLAEVCRRIADELSSASHGRCPIQLSLGALPEPARCDEGLLRHIFNNLISNAVKYSPAGSVVEWRVEHAGADAIFTVIDGGLGISEEDQARLFRAFTRGSNVGDTAGTGLGLVIVQRCVVLHGGTVAIASKLGAGTTVTVRLPVFRKQERDEVAKPGLGNTSGHPPQSSDSK